MPSSDANRMSSVPFSGIRRIFDEASRMEASGLDIIHLEIGRPDFDTPAHIKQAAKTALDQGQVHYTANAGTLALRRAIAAKLKQDNGLEYDAESEILVTVGASEAVYLAMLAFLNPGDEILAPSIGWINYHAVPGMVSASIATYPVREAMGFKVQATAIKSAIARHTKMLILNSPGNPTGAVADDQDLQQVARIAREHNLLVLSDEIYEKIIYDAAKHISIASLPGMRERTIVVNGFSKAYSMTGWRLGYVAAPRELAAPMLKAHQYITTSAVSFAQAGAVAALEGPQDSVAAMTEEFKRRRDLLIPSLNAIPGISCVWPSGAFYAFPNVRAFRLSSEELTWHLLREAGVAVVPGSIFGSAGEGHLRISFANSYEKIQKALERLADVLSKLPRQPGK
jgi:aminotransferase